ncbi:speckle-type POZ protein-like B isoform X2 [Dendroctonus ponderosae]|uniref:speckle-type POZ protein-like B isoform X2 n=1 Tax=Dendroctonus ponderosae TaxID=77166 RepID=UPI0020365521|nr:speckle-type POZ protein-like B isoform X2 [Dendroctonus ponderosae]XP_048523036.1 speckle-type POZ protein-like B isoform X2 [Dendroctonus ponderosae]
MCVLATLPRAIRLNIMPTKPKNKAKNTHNSKESLDIEVGSIHEELEVPVASELVFRKIWKIKRFHHTIKKRDLLDSPEFRCSVNGMTTFWNISVRFWKGANGKKVTNPLVICLNLTGSETEETGQARVRFQFGVWNAHIKHWECCPISSVVLNLQNTKELLSVGYKSLGVMERHIDPDKDVKIMVKIQIIQSDEEVHSLSQDMARLMVNEESKDTLIECYCDSENKDCEKTPLIVHSWIIRTRSDKLATRMEEQSDGKNKGMKYLLCLPEYSYGVVNELVRYIYTDKVDCADKYAAKLLPISIVYHLQGLKGLCERHLIESLTPANVANILLLADQCRCENLRKAALHYCEGSDEIKGNVHMAGKTLAWRVMEMVNPDLFMEACESIGSSSSNLDSPGTPGGSWSD